MSAGVYLHIPFCKSRCSYCDFATDIYKNSEAVERYINALVREINSFCPQEDLDLYADFSVPKRSILFQVFRPVPPVPPFRNGTKRNIFTATDSNLFIDTIYFGGGTPSVLTAKQVEKILRSVHDGFDVRPDTELTMEMNPAMVSLETLRDYKSLGVNRASFGVQTFDDIALKLLARGHDANDARRTFRLLREAEFENISFDLIAGLPRQTLSDWEKNLDEALNLQPEHLSLYLLEIHEGTPLAEQIRSTRAPAPNEDLAAQMYELMLDKVSAAGYDQYEISNFSRPGFESRHNSKYWRLESVYGFGVSAHSFDGSQRYANERDTAKYVNRVEERGSAEVMREKIDVASEFAFLGLRMTDGIDLEDYENRFNVNLAQKYGRDLEELKESGLVKILGHSLQLTPKGMLFSNEVFRVFV